MLGRDPAAFFRSGHDHVEILQPVARADLDDLRHRSWASDISLEANGGFPDRHGSWPLRWYPAMSACANHRRDRKAHRVKPNGCRTDRCCLPLAIEVTAGWINRAVLTR